MADAKSTVEEIRARFDREVERFSNLETGQSATIDAPLALELIQAGAARLAPNAKRLLDVGCGAGNYSLKLLEALPNLEITLVDLSQPMLERALERLNARGSVPRLLRGDIRELEIGEETLDLIVAAAVLHHLRTDAEWEAVFRKFCRALKPGGSLWISDLVHHSTAAVQDLMWDRYGEYLRNLKDAEYQEHVFAYVAREDTPRPLLFQTDLLRAAGFRQVDVLHKNSCFAVFCALK